MLGFLKDQLMIEALKLSVKSNVKHQVNTIKERYRKSKFRSQVKKMSQSIDHQYTDMGFKSVVQSGWNGVIQVWNGARYWYITGEKIPSFVELTLTWKDVISLMRDGTLVLETGMELKVSNKEQFNGYCVTVTNDILETLLKERKFVCDHFELKVEEHV